MFSHNFSEYHWLQDEVSSDEDRQKRMMGMLPFILLCAAYYLNYKGIKTEII